MRKTIATCLLIVAVTTYAQNHQTSWQNAFYKSYEAEKAGKYTLAINELKKVYKTDNYFVNIRLGWLHYLSKQHAEAEKHYLNAIRLKPYSIEARFGIVKPYSATEQWDKVKEQYHQILKIDPQNTVANYWLGVIYYNRKNYQNAVKLFEKVVNLYPLDYDSVIMLAWTKLNLGKSAEASILFNHALTLRPGDESATNGLKLIK
ncbi:MAG: tetratricopeptide repeat protein [Paludibacter sp.]|nr:tetratricopeptide repeat protein [Paludibacter sp.]